jgi:hypothetical protein
MHSSAGETGNGRYPRTVQGVPQFSAAEVEKMNLFPFSLDNQKLRKAIQIAASLGDDARKFFSPTPAVRKYLRDVDEAKLVRAITGSREDHRPVQEGLQAYGTYWKDTKCAWANAIALAIWELSRRSTEGHFPKAVVPTFGEIGAVAAGVGVQPRQGKRNWGTEETVQQFAKGLRSYCATTCDRRLAVSGGELPPGEQVGITSLLLNTNTAAETDLTSHAKDVPHLADDKPPPSIGSRSDTSLPVDVEAQDLSDNELEEVILEDRGRFPGDIETSSTVTEVRRRRGQAKLRELTLRSYGSTCALCEVSDTKLLVTSHIVGWSERTETRGLLNNALCLCRFHDALFENGYWSLSDDLRVVHRSPIDSATIQALLPTTCSFRRPTSHPPAPEYARHHRTRHGL